MSVWDEVSNGAIDWDLVIERNVRLLSGIVATLFAMAGLALSSPLAARRGAVAEGHEKPRNGLFERPSARSHSGGPGPARQGEAEALAGPGEGCFPRQLHRAVYRLLRAAEAAVRRLIVVVGRDMVAAELALPPLPPTSGPLVRHIHVNLGLACAAPAEAPSELPAVRRLSFPLLDPLPDPDAPPFHIRTSGVPRISVPGWTPLFPVAQKQKPTPNDPIDAGYLRLRLDALASALSDLPRPAMRLARWQARREAARKAGRVDRLSPLRPGPAYALRRPGPNTRSTTSCATFTTSPGRRGTTRRERPTAHPTHAVVPGLAPRIYLRSPVSEPPITSTPADPRLKAEDDGVRADRTTPFCGKK